MRIPEISEAKTGLGDHYKLCVEMQCHSNHDLKVRLSGNRM